MPLFTRFLISLAATVVSLMASYAANGQVILTQDMVSIGKPDTLGAIINIESASKWHGIETIDAARVVRFGNPQLIREGSVVVLDDGSRLVAKELHTVGISLHAYNQLWDEITLPLRPVRGILLRAHTNPDQTQAALDRISDYQGTRDRLLLANGDFIDGIFRQLTPLTVEFQVGDKALKLDRKRVLEIEFAQPAGSLPKAQEGIWIGFEDGSMLLASDLKLADERLQVQLAGGITLYSSNLENAYRYITYLRPLGVGVRYLSDEQAIGFKSLGFLSAGWDYQQDRNVLGGTLKSGGYVSQKGLGLHATSRIAYKVNEGDVRFRAKVGIDDDTNGAGSVIFKVYTTRTGKEWKPVFESPIVRGGEKPLDVSVPVAGMKGIALVVEFADGADVLDHADWLDARLESK